MKKTLILSTILLSTAGAAFSQVRVSGTPVLRATNRDGVGIIGKNEDVEGSQYLSETWVLGTVIFKNGGKAEGVVLNFDLYGNKPQFKQDNQVLDFGDPVKEVVFTGQVTGQQKRFQFRNGYPEVDNLSEKFYYQVVADGPSIQVLKYLEKVVGEEMVSIGTVKKSFKSQEGIYLFNPLNNKIIKLPKNKKELQEQAPVFSDKLSAYMGANKGFNPRKEGDLVEMANQLNK
ncbi:hypothetical protein ACFSQD_02905 [Flavihumibacter stibioxidans]|uniref:DUF4352 domain-containing protein n=1 Tax=Flavihumibacter stibioxidans TaxID=1834163 RepID=A0ABR7MDJ8_9BACT|nr:hypothetical protein [Flavihumibacter stibioxidans]MBC6493098.1 hypothetical protein [Flavihumibacter stibioxidans]